MSKKTEALRERIEELQFELASTKLALGFKTRFADFLKRELERRDAIIEAKDKELEQLRAYANELYDKQPNPPPALPVNGVKVAVAVEDASRPFTRRELDELRNKAAQIGLDSGRFESLLRVFGARLPQMLTNYEALRDANKPVAP